MDPFDTVRVAVDDKSHQWLEPFAIEFSTTTHQIPTLGVRVSVDDVHVVYSADTGPGWRVPPSWRRPDLAVLECTYSNTDEVVWPYHLSSNDVADLAEEIDAATTLITHVPPRTDATARLREVREASPRRLFVLAELGQRVVITHREVQE
jgi:ribonuclease BN (tRNA processing enzyme)